MKSYLHNAVKTFFFPQQNFKTMYTLFHFDGTGNSILILGGYNHFRNPVFISLMGGGTSLLERHNVTKVF